MNILHDLYWLLAMHVKQIAQSVFGSRNSATEGDPVVFLHGLFSITAVRQPSDMTTLSINLKERVDATLKQKEWMIAASERELYPLVVQLAAVWQELKEVDYVSAFVDIFAIYSRWHAEPRDSSETLMRKPALLAGGFPAIPDRMAAAVRGRLTMFKEFTESEKWNNVCFGFEEPQHRESQADSLCEGSENSGTVYEYRKAVYVLSDLIAGQSEEEREAQADADLYVDVARALESLIVFPPEHERALGLLASGLRHKSRVVNFSGHSSLAGLELADSALGEFERSKGRLPHSLQGASDFACGLDTSPVVRVFRHIWKNIIKPLSRQSYTLDSDNVTDTLKRPLMSLRKALQGFAIVTKGLLDLEVMMDLEQDLFTSSSIVLRVEKRGALLGRVFAEVTAGATADPFILSVRCRTRNSGPGIVLASLHCLKGETQTDNSDMRTFLDSVQLSSAKTVFHELAHSLHCLASDVFLPTSALRSGPMDYNELPSHLFEYFGRDWIDYSSGLELTEAPSPVFPAFVSITEFVFLTSAVRSAVRVCGGAEAESRVESEPLVNWMYQVGLAVEESPHVDSAAVLDDDDWRRDVPANVYHGAVKASVVGYKEHPFGHILAQPMAAMIYSKGSYREKLYGIFQKALSVSAGAPAVEDPLSWSSNVEALSGEDGLRRFFQLGGSRVSFRTFFSIVPGLEKRLDDAEYIEDAIDFDPWIEELSRGAS